MVKLYTAKDMEGLLILFITIGCMPGLSSAEAAKTAGEPGVIAGVALTVDQVYAPTNTRDPFKTSVIFGDEHNPKTDTGAGGVAISSFSIYNLSLIGIIEDSRGKEAMLSDTRSGWIYILRGGKLIDSKKRKVPGVTGIVKGKQVVLTTEDKQINQLNLREKQ